MLSWCCIARKQFTALQRLESTLIRRHVRETWNLNERLSSNLNKKFHDTRNFILKHTGSRSTIYIWTHRRTLVLGTFSRVIGHWTISTTAITTTSSSGHTDTHYVYYLARMDKNISCSTYSRLYIVVSACVVDVSLFFFSLFRFNGMQQFGSRNFRCGNNIW